MNIILCGMPGSGKAYWGKITAEQINYSFIDTDDLVISEYHKRNNIVATCREIALKEGAPYFRNIESVAINSLATVYNTIIAVGGGALSSSENIEFFKKLGLMIYLKASPELLLERLLEKNAVPSYVDKHDIEGSFMQLLELRRPKYEQNCEYCIDVEKENVPEMIKTYLNLKGI